MPRKQSDGAAPADGGGGKYEHGVTHQLWPAPAGFDSAKELALLEKLHCHGMRDAARLALEHCAWHGVVMPGWLADLVLESLDKSAQGNPNNPLGFGNERMRADWRKQWLRTRDEMIREQFQIVREWYGDKMTSGEIIKSLAARNYRSIKAIEKILFPPRSPTAKPNK